MKLSIVWRPQPATLRSYYAAFPKGHIKRCIQSVCLSVRSFFLLSPAYTTCLQSECREIFKFGGDLATDTINRESKFKVKVIANENVKIVFRAHLRQKWIDFYQTKWPSAHYTHIDKHVSWEKMRNFDDICPSVYLSHTFVHLELVYILLELTHYRSV